MSEREEKLVEMATIYRLSLIFKSGEKKEYTLEEILKLLDDVAMAKEQEN